MFASRLSLRPAVQLASSTPPHPPQLPRQRDRKALSRKHTHHVIYLQSGATASPVTPVLSALVGLPDLALGRSSRCET